MPPEIVLITIIAIVAGCGTLIVIAKMIGSLIKARMGNASGEGGGSLTRSELENLIRKVIREEQTDLYEGIDQIEKLLENPRKLEARRTVLLDATLEPDQEETLEPARKKRELT